MKYPTFSLRRSRRFVFEAYGWLWLRRHQELWDDLRSVTANSSSRGCTFYELYLLFRHVVTYRPAFVLELGSGVSTVLLAHAAREVRAGGAPCTIVSMEESDFYYADLYRLLPQRVTDCVELIQSPTEDRTIGDRIARCYVNKPRHPYGLVFIDGPQIPKDATYFDGDVLDVLEWNPNAFTAYLDSREGTRANLCRMFPWARTVHDKRHKFTRFDFPDEVARQ